MEIVKGNENFVIVIEFISSLKVQELFWILEMCKCDAREVKDTSRCSEQLPF